MLDLGAEEEEDQGIFSHSNKFDQGGGNIRRGAVTYVVAKDGSGDFATIKEALKSLPTLGGKIQVKEGTYIEYNIIIPYNNVTIEGVSQGTPTIQISDNNGILVDGKNGIVICNMTIGGGSTVGKYGISIKNSYDCSIKENYIAQMVGIQLVEGSYKNSISNNIFQAGDDQIIISGANLNNVLGNTFREASTESILIKSSSQNNIISNNNILNAWEGIYVASGANNILNNNNISNDQSGTYENAIWIDTQGDRNTIVGNCLKGILTGSSIKNNGTNTQIAHNITE